MFVVKCFLIFLLAVQTAFVDCEDPFKTIFSWKKIDYQFPNESVRKAYESSGAYVKAHAIPLGLNVWNDKMFITIPRWKKGVPANLNYINLSNSNPNDDGSASSPLLNPYPDWQLNDIRSPDSLVNLLRVRIDACDRLWAVDSGIDDISGEFRAVQPPKLIAIDLKTNKIILRYPFKATDLTPATFFADTVVDVDPKNCSDAYVYNSDFAGYGLVVYSLAKNDSWRITHNYFYLDPLHGNFNVSGVTFQWADGLFGMALSPPKEDGSKTLYFHSMAGIHEFSVSTSLLKNQTALANPNYWQEFKVVGDKGPSTQGGSSMFDPKTGIIYFTQVNTNAVACWDTHNDLTPDSFKIIAQDDEDLIFPNDIIIDSKTNKFYCLSDNLPRLLYDKYNAEETNFYVHVASLDDLTAACKANKTVI